MPPSRLLGAQLLIHLAVAAATAAVLLAVGALAFGVDAPAQPAGWVLAYLLSCVAMLSLGVLIAAVAPSAKVANAFGTILFFPIAFFAGLWLPRQSMPHTLAAISDYTPLGAAIRDLTAATNGRFPPVTGLLTLAGYALVFCPLAIRLFRWE